MIKITLNGKKIKAKEAKTILEVANDNGIDIPTLCHDEELSAYGSCWVCAVKVKDQRGFVTACGTKIEDGMDIQTESDEVRAARKMALELLLSDHYADCEAPCKTACPADIDVQTYVSLIANGEYKEAVKVIKEKLPMPLSIGRVCPAFCEEECRREIVDDAIAIRQLKRYAADMDLDEDNSYVPPKEPEKKEKIAIIGGGPSGLSCGFYLSTKGYKVKVFEAEDKAGGWLRYGIPEYRLPKKILDKEIDLMCKNGMEIITGQEVGKDLKFVDIYKEYDAVYLAMGAQKAVPMRVKGTDLKGCYLGVDFLKDVVKGNKVSLGKSVAVIGGGNTAIDCARTAKRLGADVTIAYRRTRKEMPAEDFEIEAAEEEGIKFRFLTNPVENYGKKGKLYKIKFEKMILGEPDESGRRRPKPTGETFNKKFDSVIAAISQKPAVDFLKEEKNKIENKLIPLTRWSTIESDENTMYSGVANIFGGGDFRNGPATAVEAIADGKKAADYIDKYIKGEFDKFNSKPYNSQKASELEKVNPAEYEIYEKKKRIEMPELSIKERIKNFKEVEEGFNTFKAAAEANRCLECGCQVNETCYLREYATNYKVDKDLFIGSENKHPIDKTHPFILRDANKCIKCGRCVRICAEVQGPGVLGYIYRGFISYVAPPFDQSLKDTDCLACGKCIEVCPVGALTPRNINYKLNPYPKKVITQNCGLCGTGCKIDIETQNDRVTTIKPSDAESFNDRNLCFDGKFGWQIYTDEKRVLVPQIRNNKDNDWQKGHKKWETIDDNNKIAELIKKKMGQAETKNIYVSPNVSNEELLMVNEIAKTVNAQVSSLTYHNLFTDKLADKNLFAKSYDDLEKAGTIVIVGSISRTLQSFIRRLQKNGKELIIIDEKEQNFNYFADKLYDGESISLTLDEILEPYFESSEKEDEIDKIDIDLSNKTMFIYERENLAEGNINKLWMLASLVCDFEEGSGVLETSHYCNLKAFQKIDVKESKPQISDFVLLYGDLPSSEQLNWLKKSKFVIAIDTHMDSLTPAEIFIPMPSYLEKSGSSIANDGRITEFKNSNKSKMMSRIMDIFYKAGMLNEEESKIEFWQKKAKKFIDKRTEKSAMTPEQLFDFLNNIEDIEDEKIHYEDIKSIKISEIKKLMK